MTTVGLIPMGIYIYIYIHCSAQRKCGFETALNRGEKVLTQVLMRYWQSQKMRDYLKKEKRKRKGNLIEIKGDNIRCYFTQEQLEISFFYPVILKIYDNLITIICFIACEYLSLIIYFILFCLKLTCPYCLYYIFFIKIRNHRKCNMLCTYIQLEYNWIPCKN